MPIISDYVEKDNKWCAPRYDNEYQDLTSAKNACGLKKTCGGFYDFDNKAKTFVLCNSEQSLAVMKSSKLSSSRIYLKCTSIPH